MDKVLVDSLNFNWLSSSFMPSTCSKKCFNEKKPGIGKNPSGFRVAAKKTNVVVSKGLQKRQKKELSKMLWTEAAIKAIESKAGSKKYKNLWPKAVLEALDDAIQLNNWESALKIFGLLRKQHWYKPRCQTYTKLLMMLGKCRKAEQAGLLFEVMLSDGLQPTVDVFSALVNAYGMCGLFDQAFSTIDDMKSVYDCKPNVYTYTILLSCCIKHHRLDLVSQILAEMTYLGIECSSITYNTVIDGYGKAEMFEMMENVLSDMIDSGTCHPDVFTMNSFISAYGNCGQIEKMERSYEEFQLMGISPDVRTFNILIRSYGRARMYQKMESILDFMKNRFFSPTIVTLNTVIDIYGRAGDIEKMDKFFLKMKHQGMKPNTITYCSLVNAYSKAGKLFKVDSILRQVENSNAVLDTPFFNCVISAYGRAGDVDKMSKVFSEMTDKNCEPDYVTFATMVQAYDAKGMSEVAEHLEAKMLSTETCSEPKLLGC
ncbi:pentatricopeptide repeat-containing protein At3g53170-like [Chenopodium quinoa]|uniref:pentatricopeptide repeat-containing protein At3g53170-like n=1 Tax=Chenopodium quinoa TaxID=63459 RepID=UPI000B795463|nr:pentatricopeptide repeat-containing protein At3g53170-like [Chenopodium quinoa]XP_021736228.1 pentatricopeptide repeat-containing protein At3g53170-like [Chenopodium quinoa]